MENLGVDIKLLVAQLINFGLFFFLYKRFIAKPFLSIMNDEKKKDEDKKALFETIETQKKKMLDEEKQSRDQIRKKMNEAVLAAQKAADTTRESVITKAKQEAEEIIKKATKQLEEERKQMELSYKETVAKVSVLTVENVLKDYLTEDMQKEVNKRVLTNLQANS